jgi:hypothetical protein
MEGLANLGQQPFLFGLTSDAEAAKLNSSFKICENATVILMKVEECHCAPVEDTELLFSERLKLPQLQQQGFDLS